MLFNSFEFLVFLFVVLTIFYCIPTKSSNLRLVLLLLASYVFYGWWKIEYLSILILSTTLDYFVARQIDKIQENNNNRFYLLLISIFSNFGLLFYFKYYNFFSGEINNYFLNSTGHPLPYSDFLLPIGISFYTFQTVSYTIDVYRREMQAEKSFLKFALYVNFFPQLVAGPIERAKHLLNQFHFRTRFSLYNFEMGISKIIWGFFKKIVIADRLAIMVDHVYANPSDFPGGALWLGTIFFSIQIYCDFSGYSDIAIGTARLLGIDIMENFKAPYFSKSIKEFWARWHISLSTWFRDYLYIPLGGSRNSSLITNRNLLIVFLISGFWHGANWTYLIWGGIHGVLLVFERKNKILKHKINWLNTLLVFFMVNIAWIFFRSEDLTSALKYITFLFTKELTEVVVNIRGQALYLGQPLWRFYSVCLLVATFMYTDYLTTYKEYGKNLNAFSWKKRYPIMIFGVLSILILGVFDVKEFIYFQF